MVTRKERRDRQQITLQIKKRYERQRVRNLVNARPGKLQFIIVLDNLKPTFNIGKIFRSADAMGAREIHLVGNHFFDPKPAKGSFKWVPVVYHDTFEQCYRQLDEQGYSLFTMEPVGGQPLHQSELPEKSAFVLGHEDNGISFDKNDYPGIGSLFISQAGRVESLNVSVAASIVMYEYYRQNA